MLHHEVSKDTIAKHMTQKLSLILVLS